MIPGLLALASSGCATQPGSTTGSPAPAGLPPAAVITPGSRLEHLAWNSAWALACGFYLDNAKLKSTYLAYEASAGTPPDQVAKLASSYDRVQGTFGAVAVTHSDQCTEQRKERIKAAIARYLAGDFNPGEAA